jgi:hypothetical protein
MKKLWIPIVAALLGLGLGATLLSLKPLSAHGGGMGMMGPGMMGWGPWRGWSQQGPGSSDYPNWQNMHEECEEMMEQMMGQRGWYDYSRHYGPSEGWKQQTGKTLTQENAVSIVQGYLKGSGNPNLKIGKVEKKEDGNYLVEILTKEGSLVDKIVVDRKTGRFTSIYREDLD